MNTTQNSTQSLRWLAVRTLYVFDKKTTNSGATVFEERIVVFSGRTTDEIMAKARQEADEYTAFLGTVRHPVQMGYEQDGDALIDGYEVWSELYNADMTLNEFYSARYKVYALTQED